MIRIAICDDEPKIRSIIQEQVSETMRQISVRSVISPFPDGTELIADCMNNAVYDLFILDIEMPGLDGLETARMLRKASEDPIIIFLTSHEQHARVGYQVKAHRFVLKKYLENELKEALISAIPLLEKKPVRISFLTCEDELIRIPIRDIQCFEVINRKIFVHTISQSFESKERLPFAEFSEPFSNQGFFPCYRGIMVNLDAVWSLMNDEIILTNGRKIPVSRSQLKQFMSLIAEQSGGVS